MFSRFVLFSLFSTLALASYIPLATRDEGTQISDFRSVSNPGLCITNQWSNDVEMTGCGVEGSSPQAMQRYTYIFGQSAQIRRHSIVKDVDTQDCLDAGDDVSNGSGITVQSCEEGKGSQMFKVGRSDSSEDDQHNLMIAIGSGDSQKYCLDVEKDSTGSWSNPFGYEKELQAWECHAPDHPDAAQQYFNLV
ncbi:hypothetical protein I302_103513 [Kwoniella bestiolae CBS 10118]|uniref:Ricin B lectin domain-containing protein n=1 Tax=Kwoniella bestiolae CBS 10118 TaxID=1296100 RepID=A0AAJ8K5X7_9TREE